VWMGGRWLRFCRLWRRRRQGTHWTETKGAVNVAV